MVFSSEQVMHMFNMMQNKLKVPPKKKRKVSGIEPNEEVKQMFKVAVDKPKYSDSDNEYFFLSCNNNFTLNQKLDRKCIPETVGEVSNKKDKIVLFKILLDSGTTATIIKTFSIFKTQSKTFESNSWMGNSGRHLPDKF
jgi:hypothetical protein